MSSGNALGQHLLGSEVGQVLLLLLQVFPPPTPIVNVNPPPTGLPLWAQVLSLAVTLALATIKAIEFFRRGTLEVRITRDCFFRLSDIGESLFIHAGMIARNGPVLIQNVSVTLKRLGNSSLTSKTFPMEVIDNGEKVKGSGIRADHHFYGASPLLYVNGASTFRPVYYCIFPEYRDRQIQSFKELTQELLNYKREKDKAEAEGKSKSASDVVREVEQIIKPQYNAMCGLIQIESGDYELMMTISYEKCGFPVSKKATTSFLYFTIDDSALSNFKSALANGLYVYAENVLDGQTHTLLYPELQPKKMTEAGRKKKDAKVGA
jgi:hypothetical protein